VTTLKFCPSKRLLLLSARLHIQFTYGDINYITKLFLSNENYTRLIEVLKFMTVMRYVVLDCSFGICLPSKYYKIAFQKLDSISVVRQKRRDRKSCL
jgi:hypothetical protein